MTEFTEPTEVDAVDKDIQEMPSDKVADLVEYIVCGLVDNEDAVALRRHRSRGWSLD